MNIFKRFRQLSDRASSLPASHVIPRNLIQTGEHPVVSGSFGDVWEGIHDNKPVTIKAVRVYKPDDVKEITKASFPIFAISSGSSS